MSERSENARAAAVARKEYAKQVVKQFAKAFEPHPGSTPAGHKKK